MTGSRGKVVLASFALLSIAGGSLSLAPALAAPVSQQDSRAASFVPPTSEEAPLSLIYQSLSTPALVGGEKEESASSSAASGQAVSGQTPSASAAGKDPAIPPVAPPASGSSDAAKGSAVKTEALKIETRIESLTANKPENLKAPPQEETATAQARSPVPAAATTTASPSPSTSAVATVPPAVTASPLAPVHANAYGLLSGDEGGFGAEMWKGTAYATVERLMPSLALPTVSPILNELAYRLLATSAIPPEGESAKILPGPNLSSLRIEKLVALGRPVEAWRMAVMAKEGQLDDAVLRATAEMVLASGDQTGIAQVCARAPDMLKEKASPDWQKILVVCNLRANDMKSAQLGLDVMTAQNVKDDLFFFLATKNALGGSKQLPRQLTPLKPLPLALLRLANLPLRNELYARPAAAMIPEVLKSKTENVNARLALAERAAAQGLIDAELLGLIYADVDFSTLPIAARETNARRVRETGSILRARLYQIAMSDKDPDNRLFAALRLIQSVPPAEQGGTMRNLALAMLGDFTPQKASSLMTASPAAALMISLLADDKPDHTLGWLKAAHDAAAQTPSVARALKGLWPLIALGGFESDKAFANDLKEWLNHVLKAGDSARPSVSASSSGAAAPVQEEAERRDRREAAGIILLTLDAAGLAVPDDVWAQVVDAPTTFDKVQFPPALLLERLKDSGRARRKGETVLEALAATGGAAGAIPLAVRVDIIRALRHAGFTREAAAFARETLLTMRVVSAGGQNGDDSP